MKENSIDVVFSDQLIVHLHPDDTELHFNLVRNILKPKSIYVFRTPHRISGPHDVSSYFSNEAQGFNLKEWTYGELSKALNKANYSSYSGYWYAKRVLVKIPFVYFIFVESTLNWAPTQLRKAPSKYLLPGITMLAVK